MTSIKDLESQIEGAEDALTFVKDQLAGLKANLQELKEQQQQQEPESLFGRWATHPEHGRGIIASSRTGDGNRALFGNISDPSALVAQWRYVPIGELTLDPATINTTEDFQDAPEGTIVEATTEQHDVYVKTGELWYVAGDITEFNPTTMPTCRVIRWGENK